MDMPPFFFASNFPPLSAIPTDPLQELNKRFPEQTPKLTDSLDTIRFKSGQRDLMQFLNAVFIARNYGRRYCLEW